MEPTPSFLDTLSLERRPLPPSSKENPLRVFVCGPTVYDYIHIGNARTYLVFDTFVTYLRSIGTNVFYLQNITDVDDKIIIRAERDHTTAAAVSAKYQKAYLESMKTLGITSVDKYAPATKFIPQIVDQVERLIEKGHVYKAEDGYYFDLTTFPDYGHLSRRTVSQAEDGVSRIDESVAKRNRGDFCVWKFSKPGEPIWKTRIGDGRPGWHIEDTAISENFFGSQYDIHGGGADLKFPHHEAEIAQQESASGKKPFVKIWMHVGSLTVNGRKMSKSLGNFVTLNDFLTKYKPQVLRLIALSNHYRSPLNYTEELAEMHAKNWQTIQDLVWKLDFISKKSKQTITDAENLNFTDEKEKFFSALANDFNTPEALSCIYNISSIKTHTSIWIYSKTEAKKAKDSLSDMLAALGLSVPSLKIPPEVKTLVKARDKALKQAKIDKQFIQSDDLRNQINTLGYNVDDTPLGQFVRPR